MSEFFEHKLNLEPQHFSKLGKGKAHTVKAEQIGSGMSLQLSSANHKKIMNGFQKKKNKVLKLTKAEIEQNELNETEGAGFFKTLNKLGVSRKKFMGGVQTIAKAAAPVIKDIGQQAAPGLGLALSSAMGNPEMAPFATIGINKALDIGTKRMADYGQTGNGLKQDVYHTFDKAKKFVGGSISDGINKVNYHDDYGFKPTVGTFSKVLNNPVIVGDTRSEVNPLSIYKNGYNNIFMPKGHQTYTPFIQRPDVYVNGNIKKEGGSFLPSGYSNNF